MPISFRRQLGNAIHDSRSARRAVVHGVVFHELWNDCFAAGRRKLRGGISAWARTPRRQPAPSVTPAPTMTPAMPRHYTHRRRVLAQLAVACRSSAEARNRQSSNNSRPRPLPPDAAARPAGTRFGKPHYIGPPDATRGPNSQRAPHRPTPTKSPWKSMSDGTQNAWHKTVDWVTPGDGSDVAVVAERAARVVVGPHVGRGREERRTANRHRMDGPGSPRSIGSIRRQNSPRIVSRRPCAAALVSRRDKLAG